MVPLVDLFFDMRGEQLNRYGTNHGTTATATALRGQKNCLLHNNL